jgi:hypothetical protein
MKTRNPIARVLRENPKFKLKIRSDKRKPPKDISLQEATAITEEEKEIVEKDFTGG